MEESCTNAVFLYFDCPEIKLAFLQHTKSFSHTRAHTHTWPWLLDYSETDVVRRAELMKKVFYWSVNQYFSPLELYSRGQQKVWADTDSLTVIQQIYQLVKISAAFIKYYKCYIPWYDSHIFWLLRQFNEVENTVVALALKSCIYTLIFNAFSQKCFHEDEMN